MRIALVHDLPAGGALRFVRETTRRSVADHHYTLVTSATSPIDPELARVVHDVVETDVCSRSAWGRAGQLVEFFAGQRAIARIIEDGEFDVVLAHPSQFTQAPPALLTLTKTPSLYFMHEVRRRTYEPGYQTWISTGRGPASWPRAAAACAAQRGFGVVDRRATAAATALAANSKFTAEAIARVHGRSARVCHPGVDFETFRPRQVTPDRIVVSVGALDPTKGHECAVDALALLPTCARPALTVVFERRDPVFETRLQERARAKSVELRLLPHIPDLDLALLYASASATIAAAPLEPLGLTVLESIAAGTPVVAIRQGGYRETVTDGVNGILVDPDPYSVAQGVVAAATLRRRTDPGTLRATISDYWTWARCVDDLHAALERVAKR